MRRLKWIIALPLAALLLAMGGTWTYINVFSDDAPARLTLEGTVAEGLDDSLPATTATTAAGAVTEVPVSFDGTWMATTGSQAGYRVNEVLFSQSVEAVGRTSNVDGALTISRHHRRDGGHLHRPGLGHERREPPRQPVPGPDHERQPSTRRPPSP